MILLRVKEGLGNQMFQYAAAFAVSRRKETSLAFYFQSASFETAPRQCELGHFKISGELIQCPWNTYLNSGKIGKIYALGRRLVMGRKRVFLEKSLSYDSKILEMNSDCFLEGYFQSELYFADRKDEVRAEFQFAKELDNKSLSLLDLIGAKDIVSVHVRRGDYVKSTILKVYSSKYYNAAIQYLQNHLKSPIFLVFSEDLNWAKENLNLPSDSIFVDWTDKEDSSADMQLMSKCHHHIIPNSTYGWWAAWLNQSPNKIVCVPDKWFVEGVETDIYLDSFVKIPTLNQEKP